MRHRRADFPWVLIRVGNALVFNGFLFLEKNAENIVKQFKKIFFNF